MNIDISPQRGRGDDTNEKVISAQTINQPKKKGGSGVVSYKTAVRIVIRAVIILFLVCLLIQARNYIGYILGGLGGIGALLVGVQARRDDLKDRTDSLKDRVNKRRAGPLVIIVCFLGLLFCCQPATASLYIPEDYETLKEYYILADQDLMEALDIIDEYQKREEFYLQQIDYYKRPRWCLVAGAYVDESAQLKLGFGRKYELYLVSAGVVYDKSMSVYCEAIVWIQSPF